jgi:uncharacterized protein DUF4129
MKQQGQRIAAVIVAVAGLALVILATRSERTRDISSRNIPYKPPKPKPGPSGRPTGAPPTSQNAPDAGNPLPHWVGVLFLVVVSVIVAALVALLIVHVVRVVRRMEWSERDKHPDKPDAELSPADLARQLEEAVDEVLLQIERGETNEAIIACWMRLEDVAAAAGTERRPAETSAELTARVLEEHQVSAGTLAHLSELYREARFSAHALPDASRDEARAALEQIRTELRTGVVP